MIRATAHIGGLLFQFPDETLRHWDPDEPPDAIRLLTLVTGPYCSTCKRALSDVSYTEWSTSEGTEEPVPARCGACGASTGIGSQELFELRGEAFAALGQRLRNLELR